MARALFRSPLFHTLPGGTYKFVPMPFRDRPSKGELEESLERPARSPIVLSQLASSENTETAV